MAGDLESRVVVVVVSVNEVIVDELFGRLFRCTRILVKVGEIGKYSISVSSVDRVSGL